MPTSVDLPFSRTALTVLKDAERQAAHFGHEQIGSSHLLSALLRDDNRIAHIFSRLKVDIEAARDRIMASLRETRPLSAPAQTVARQEPRRISFDLPAGIASNVAVDSAFWRAIRDAMDEAGQLSHLLVALLLNENSRAYRILRKHGLDLDTVRRYLKTREEGDVIDTG